MNLGKWEFVALAMMGKIQINIGWREKEFK
jgi:hypothetical protein